MRRAELVALVCAVGAGCARPRPEGYVNASARAARAAHAGRHAEAAALWADAAPLADRPRDEDDARYRAAYETLRAGDQRRALAMLDALGLDAAHPPIAARARLAAALLRLRFGEPGERAHADGELRALVTGAPGSGAGRRALDHVLRRFDEAGDAPGALAWLRETRVDARVRDTELEPALTHHLALRLARGGDAAGAVALWQDLFSRRGFGRNTHWDDGHLALAQTLREAGRARDAVAALDAMVAPWSTSWFVGSYTGPRLPEAAMLRARICRDDLGDTARAAEAYRFVYDRLRYSTLRDDALDESATMLVARDPDAACALWRRLYAEIPCSPRARRGGPRPTCSLSAARCPDRSPDR